MISIKHESRKGRAVPVTLWLPGPEGCSPIHVQDGSLVPEVCLPSADPDGLVLRVVEVSQDAPHAFTRHWVSIVRNTPSFASFGEEIILIVFPEVFIFPLSLCLRAFHDLAKARKLLLVAKQKSLHCQVEDGV